MAGFIETSFANSNNEAELSHKKAQKAQMNFKRSSLSSFVFLCLFVAKFCFVVTACE
jgi:hypothetical protein